VNAHCARAWSWKKPFSLSEGPFKWNTHHICCFLLTVIGIDYRILVAVVFIVCIFYSSIGGFKAVLWTDSLQAVIMVVSMAVVVIVGTNNLGGVSEVWKRADSTNRINFFQYVALACTLHQLHYRIIAELQKWNFELIVVSFRWDVDPRTRHTFWTVKF